MEIWKEIPNSKGLYQVSSLGNVRSLYYNKVKLMSSHENNYGYKSIRIIIDGKRLTYKIHQLVAMAFLNHKTCGMDLVVDHINNNKLDNRPENLQIVSSRYNNSKDKKNKTSKYTGVSWNKYRLKWRSCIWVNKKQIYLGSFNCELSASIAYQKKLKSIN